MARILALQKLQYADQQLDPVDGGGGGNSCGSSTCVGCSCASNGCGTLAGV